MSQLVYSICWNSKEVGSNASEEMDLLARARASRQREKLPLSCPLSGLPAEGVAQIGGRSSYIKRSGLKVCVFPPQGSRLEIDFPTLNGLIKQKYLPGMPIHFFLYFS